MILPRKVKSLTFSVIFLSLLIMDVSVCPISATEVKEQEIIHFAHRSVPCTKYLLDSRVTFDISPKPVKAMRDLTFRFTITGKTPASNPYIDLSMPGMNMGPNRVSLEAMGEGVYEGKGIIVRCPSGRRTWKATVTVPDLGTVEFVFDVIH